MLRPWVRRSSVFPEGNDQEVAPGTNGGRTDLDRTIPACPGHHTLLDLAGWKVALDPDTAICTWTSPDGRTLIYTHPPDP